MMDDDEGVTTLVAGADCVPLRCRWCVNRKLHAGKQPQSARLNCAVLFKYNIHSVPRVKFTHRSSEFGAR